MATASKLATIYYKMVYSDKVAFTPIDQTNYQKKRIATKIAYMEKKLVELNE